MDDLATINGKEQPDAVYAGGSGEYGACKSSTLTSHLERKFVTLVDGSNLCRGERLWGMQV